MAGIKALVIGMGVLLLAGFVIVAVTLVNRVSSSGEAAPAQVAFRLGAGERLVGSDLDGGRIALRIETPTGARVEVRNLSDGALVAAFEGAPGG